MFYLNFSKLYNTQKSHGPAGRTDGDTAYEANKTVMRLASSNVILVQRR